MDQIWIFLTVLSILVLRTSCITIGDHNVIELCTPVTKALDTQEIYIVNRQFPTETSPRNCECSFKSTARLSLKFNRLLVQTPKSDSDIDFLIQIETSNDTGPNNLKRTLWKQKVWSDAEGVITDGHFIKIKTTGTGAENYQLGFIFSLLVQEEQANVNIVCLNDTSVRTNDDTIANNHVLAYVGELCSPPVMLLLMSLSAALLVIILIESIFLCFVAPKKHRQRIKKIRQTILLENNGGAQITGRPETRVYDECFIPDF